MKTLYSNSDLVKFGVNTLTGEACRFGMRVLCDLSAEGVELVTRFLGLEHNAQFNKNWNSTVGSAPAVASVMLTRSALRDLRLFALLHVEACDMVVEDTTGGFTGYHKTDEYYMKSRSHAHAHPENYKVHYNSASGPCVADRNVHTFTGRTE